MALALSSALDYEKKYKKETEIKRFIRKIELTFITLQATQNNNYGFYWKYYAPYFIEMHKQKQIETLAYIVFVTSNKPEITKWIKSHQKEIDKFYEWSGNFSWNIE